VTADPPLVYALASYQPLADELAGLAGLEPGRVRRRDFPDGEHYLRVEDDVAGREVVLAGGTYDDEATLELYDLASALVDSGARRLILVVPWFGYATMERAVRPGEVVKAKTRARLFSSIPNAAEGSRILMLDLHSEGIPYYFEGSLQTVHVYGRPLTLAAARRLGGERFVLASTDAGRAKWVESLANELGVPAAFVFKRRRPDGSTEVTARSAPVEGEHVVLYDDMIRTGGSLIGAARAYLEAGARSVCAVTTHAVLPGDSLERIRASGLFTALAATDSHPNARRLAGDFLSVSSVAPLFVSHLGLGDGRGSGG
jgi:ribose-phosphate pyrophosphokinase